MPETVQLIFDDAQSGAWNMALDEALLEESLRTDAVFVRMYRWREPTVSLGHFQNEMTSPMDARLRGLPCVRRLSGGGAILHHHEQTYSCAIPPQHPLAKSPYELYEAIHDAVIAELKTLGIELALRGHDRASAREPFLCFLREAATDLVFQGVKVLGSAQRRRRGAVLQHGSLLLHASPHAPEVLGLCDLASSLQLTDGIVKSLGRRIAACLGTEIREPRWQEFVSLPGASDFA